MLSGEMRGALRARAGRMLLALGFGLAVGLTSASAQQECVGDCNGDGEVRINELILAVNISLGTQDLSACEVIDANGSGTAQINELIQAVNNSLNGCPGDPAAVCALGEASTLTLSTGLLTLPLAPSGEINVRCEETDGADLDCGCSVRSFQPVDIPGIGEVCVAAAEFECPGRTADCDGDHGLDVTARADHNIGTCTSNANCAELCDTRCGELGADFYRQASTCEGFCTGGINDGDACNMDTQCPGGSCGGPDGLPDGNICECVCVEPGTGEGTVGGLSCTLGLALTVELDGSGVCGDAPPSITLPPLCGELTTGTANASIDNLANMPDLTLEAEPITGSPAVCADLISEEPTVSGTTLVGHLAFFGSAIGDILTENNFICE